jgi:hypothetical protein
VLDTVVVALQRAVPIAAYSGKMCNMNYRAVTVKLVTAELYLVAEAALRHLTV